MRTAALFLLAGATLVGASANATEFEPRLFIDRPPPGARVVAITLDACSGAVDQRVLDALLETGAKATVFATGRWLKGNVAAFAVMRAHPEQFEIENHGARHVPVDTDQPTVFGLETAGTIEGRAGGDRRRGRGGGEGHGFQAPLVPRRDGALHA